MSTGASNNRKGKEFEDEVGAVLDHLLQRYQNQVSVTKQPKLGLYDGAEVIPDYDLHIDLGFAKHRYLIECQNRRRSSTAIAHKIRSIKSLSPRSVFLFVHAKPIPKTTKTVLEQGGVKCMPFEEFTVFLGRADSVLSDIASSRSRPMHSEYRRHLSRSPDDYDEPKIGLQRIR